MTKNNIIVLFDIDNTLLDTAALKASHLTSFVLFEEVKDTLAELSKVVKLGIFSQGQIAFQKQKLRETNIEHYFFEEHTHIVEYKTEVMKEVLGRYGNEGKIFYIDDWLDILHTAKKTNPSVFTIWMKRGEYARTQEARSDFTPDAVITNLREVVPLIANQ